MFEKLSDNARLPERQHSGDAGYDLFAAERKELEVGVVELVSTGLKMSLPESLEAQVRPRSGLSLLGLTIMNSPGTIDPGYRGEVKVIMANLLGDKTVIEEGDRIAQMIFSRVEHPELELGDLDDSERGEGGFGSTGK